MADLAQLIVDEIDSLILQKVQGTLEDMSARNLGGISINPTATLAELRAMRTMYAQIALLEDPYIGPHYVVMR